MPFWGNKKEMQHTKEKDCQHPVFFRTAMCRALSRNIGCLIQI